MVRDVCKLARNKYLRSVRFRLMIFLMDGSVGTIRLLKYGRPSGLDAAAAKLRMLLGLLTLNVKVSLPSMWVFH